jgi:protein SMG6
MQHISPSRTATKPHREKDAAPKPTDFNEKMIALKRKQAAKCVSSPPTHPQLPPFSIFPSHIVFRFFSNARVKDRTERPLVPPQGAPSPPMSPPRRPQPSSGQSPPAVLINRAEPDSSEFSRLKLSPTPKSPPHAHVYKQQGKLFNPDTDPIPMRRTTEPEASSESAGSSYAPRQPADASRHNRDASQHRQLFDPRKHDPVSFSAAQARKPAPKSSGDYASVSSVSSYAHSVVSSNFTLSSGTTDGSSAPSSIFDHNKPHDEPKTNAFSMQLKKLYRDISHLETKLLADSGEPQDENRIVIKGVPSAGADDAEKARWKSLIDDHKRYAHPFVFLSDLYHLNSIS